MKVRFFVVMKQVLTVENRSVHRSHSRCNRNSQEQRQQNRVGVSSPFTPVQNEILIMKKY